MIREGEEIIAVVCGPTLCGKTTLAAALADKMWRDHKLLSLAYAPRGNVKWPATVAVTKNLAKFKNVLRKTKGLAVFWDESSTSLDTEDEEFTTQVRHDHKAFFFINHDLKCVGPMARGNMTDAYIFRQSEDRARDWSRLFADRDLLQTSTLEKREFIYKRAFEKIDRRLPTLEELARL